MCDEMSIHYNIVKRDISLGKLNEPQHLNTMIVYWFEQILSHVWPFESQ